MSIEKGVSLRGLSTVVLGALLLGLVLACSLFNQVPVARIAASTLSGNSPLAVTFDATTSTDADGAITAYVWNFGDGGTGTGPTVTHTFITTFAFQPFTVTLTVTDDDGATAQTTQTIEVRLDADAPTGTGTPTARFTVSKFIGVAPLAVAFDAVDSQAGTGSIIAYNWDFGDDKTAAGMQTTHTFSPDPDVTTTYEVTLFVWNSNSQVDTAQFEITVIVPNNDTGDDGPVADVFLTGPDVLYESTNRPTIPSLFEVKLDPRGSYADAGHGIEYYAWDFGDGDLLVETSDLEITHIYELAAPSRTYVAQLTVFDDQGMQDSAIINITLSQPEDED